MQEEQQAVEWSQLVEGSQHQERRGEQQTIWNSIAKALQREGVEMPLPCAVCEESG